MTYNEIMLIDDINRKEQELKKYYSNVICIGDWLAETNMDQMIRFKDKIEYRSQGILNRLSGPAVIKNNGDEEYYIDGKNYEKEEWKKIAVPLLREMKLKRIKKK